MLPTRRWKRLLQLITWRGDANGDSFTTANQYPFADFLLFMNREGDEAMSPSFRAKNMGIDASSALLEVLIATHRMQGGCEQE